MVKIYLPLKLEAHKIGETEAASPGSNCVMAIGGTST